MTEVKNIKIVAVGDKCSDKTEILVCYAKKVFVEDKEDSYRVTVFDNFQTTELYEGKAYNIGLCDTSGQERYDRLRPMSYPDTNVVLLFFSLVEASSLQNIEDLWLPEVNQYLEPTVPVLLVGTSLQKRDDPEFVRELEESGKEAVTTEVGMKFNEKIGGAGYFECSSRKQYSESITKIFMRAIQVVLEPPPPRVYCGKKKKEKKKSGGGCLIM